MRKESGCNPELFLGYRQHKVGEETRRMETSVGWVQTKGTKKTGVPAQETWKIQ